MLLKMKRKTPEIDGAATTDGREPSKREMRRPRTESLAEPRRPDQLEAHLAALHGWSPLGLAAGEAEANPPGPDCQRDSGTLPIIAATRA